ncbi:hypothetical protein MMC29_007007 [Sticta canariensis]|nr:hypothetical protein [Sticta canariensis]
MTKSIVFKHYQRVLAQWPVDLLRPEVSFQDVMRRRIDKRLLPLSSSSATPLQPQDKVRANDALATPAPRQPFDEKRELEQVYVLYSLLENRYHKKYPLSDRIMKPASNPAYYDNLLREFREAPQRSWFQTLINRWKGFLRFS